MRGEGRHRRARPSRTVRSRLTLLATTLVAATLLTTAVGLVILHQSLLIRGLDELLVQRTDNIETDVARGSFNAALPGGGDREDSFGQVIDGEGRVVAASPNAVRLPAMTTPLAAGSAQVLRTVSARPLSPHDFRILVRAVETSTGSKTLVVAKNLDDVQESVRILITSLALAIPVVVALLAVVVWWLMGRVLAPVEAMRAEVASMRGSELHRRVPVQDTGDEISRLARTMNALLERVEQATERQREFVADASHELRGPLTRIRSALEVNLAHPSATEPGSTYRSLLGDTAQLQQLVDDLLFLARSESDHPPGIAVPVDLDDLVLAQVRQLRARARVRVDVRAVSAARILGDAKQLQRAISNLADNAERHAATTVTFALGEQDGRSELVVADDGPGIPPEQRAAVFERFTRLDDARSRDAGGAGLGLAIVQDIVARHGGKISVSASRDGGACLVLTFPRAD